MRAGSLKAEEREALFQAVIDDYLGGPKLEDIARSRGIAYRTLQRFMSSHDREGWLTAQWSKQMCRAEDDREKTGRFNESLHNSAAYRMDKIDAQLDELKRHQTQAPVPIDLMHVTAGKLMT